MMSIGLNFGGPELKNSMVRSVLLKAVNAAAEARDPGYNNGVDGWINPIFVVPGSIWKPEFRGLRVGHFSKQKKGVVIEIAVPDGLNRQDAVIDFVVQALRESARLAATVFYSKNIKFSTLESDRVIKEIELSLAEL